MVDVQDEIVTSCIFCKIIKAELPSTKVYEDQDTVAFLDIRPVNPGHTLIVPKAHFENFLHADAATLQKLILVTQKVAKAVLQALGSEGFNLGLNNGSVAGQVVPHLHFHMMPRFSGDGYQLWNGKEYQPGQMEEVAEKIRAAI